MTAGKKATARKKSAGIQTGQRTAPRAKSDAWLTEEGLLRIAGWARDGLTDKQIAGQMGVAYSTLRAWRDRFPALSAALKCARDVADRKIENELFKRAQGYNVELKKTFKVRHVDYDESGRKVREEERLEEGHDEVHIPADVTAQIFWLKNRKPVEWRDKRPEPEKEQEEPVQILDDIGADAAQSPPASGERP